MNKKNFIAFVLCILVLYGCKSNNKINRQTEKVICEEEQNEETSDISTFKTYIDNSNEKPDMFKNFAINYFKRQIENKADDKIKDVYKNPKEYAIDAGKLYNTTTPVEKCDIIIDAFKTKDTTKLRALFCEKIILTHNIDVEIGEAMSFVDGNIVSCDDYSYVGALGGSSWKNGVLVNSYVYPTIRNVVTDTGNVYEIDFFAYNVHPNAKDEIGIQYIKITNTDTEECFQIGEYIKCNH